MIHVSIVKRFVVQLILVFMLFTLGTVIGLGIPVLYLLERQTNLQTRALSDQAVQTTSALIDNNQIQLENFSLFLSERPALKELLRDGFDDETLKEYLNDFLENMDLDAILICSPQEEIIEVGSDADMKFCDLNYSNHFVIEQGQAWFLSDATITGLDTRIVVLVGKQASSVLDSFQVQTGLEYSFFGNNQVIAATSDTLQSGISTAQWAFIDNYQHIVIEDEEQGEITYMVSLVPQELDDTLRFIGLMDISPYQLLNQQVRLIIFAALVTVSMAGGVIAVLVARRISQPINQLANAASALREGDLKTRLNYSAKVWEIDQLANALEDARVSLKHSLDQLRSEKEWIHSLLDSMIEGLIAIDDKGRITFASNSTEKILETHMINILGSNIDDVLPALSGELPFSQQMPEVNQNRQISVHLNDKDVLLAVSVSEFVPIEAGNANRALLFRDVSDEERIHRLLGDFMANITHEFRTPLSALSASVELMMDQLPNLTTPEITQLLSALNIGIVDLQSLIDNLIEASSIETGRFRVNPQPIELGGILDDALKTIRPIAVKYKLSLVEPAQKVSYMVLADRRRTIQALVNILSNAVKHSPEGGKITTSTLLMEDFIMVEISDQGKGISAEMDGQIFNRFVNPMSQDQTSPLGLGIGLSVVKAIIEAQNGQVGYRPGEHGGAVFWLTLPLMPGDTL